MSFRSTGALSMLSSSAPASVNRASTYSSSGQARAIERVLQDAARDRRQPSDWVHVNNFIDPHKPIAHPPGRAGDIPRRHAALIEDLHRMIGSIRKRDTNETLRLRRGSSPSRRSLVSLARKARHRTISSSLRPVLAARRIGRPAITAQLSFKSYRGTTALIENVACSWSKRG